MELYNMVNYLKYGKKIPDKRCRKTPENLSEDLLQLGEGWQGAKSTKGADEQLQILAG